MLNLGCRTVDVRWAVLAVYLKTVTCLGFAMLTINLRLTPNYTQSPIVNRPSYIA
jgi:hypothetical protein